MFEPFIIVMRKLFIPLILCLLLTFTFANFTAPSFEKQPLRISTTTDFFGSDKGIVTIDLNIENLEATKKELFVKIKGLESYKVNMEEIKVDETIFETQRTKEEFKQITDSKISWSEKQLRKFKITLAFDPKEIGLAKKFDVQLINDKGELIADLDPFLSGWNYRQTWCLDTNNISLSGNITNDHVILFSKTSADTDFWNNVNSDGNDLRFTDSSNNTYKYYFEDFNSTAKTMTAWVEVTETFSSSAKTCGYLYYGNSSASNVEDETGTYSSRWAMVQNLNKNFLDSTSNNKDMTTNNVTSTTGKISGAYEWDGSTSYATTPLSAGAEIGISLWAKTDSVTGDRDIWGFKREGGSGGWNIFLGRIHDNTPQIVISSSSSHKVYSSSTTISTGNWYHFVYNIKDNGEVSMYINGTNTLNTTIGYAVQNSTKNFSLGANLNGSTWEEFFDGIIDQVRFSNSLITSDEAKLLYASESGSLVSFTGQEASNTAPDLNVLSPTLDLNWNGTKTIQFEILDAENDKLDVNIYYSSSSGARTNLIYADTNLQDGTGITCNDYNFMVSRTCSYSWDTTTASDGQYYIDVNASDGSSTAQASSSQFRVDNTAPTTTFSGCTAGWHNTDKEITLSCDDGSGAGCDGTTYRINGGAWNNYTIPFSLSTDLNHQIDYNSIDAVGNQETIKTEYCAIDKTAPTYTSIDNNGIIFYEPFEIKINGVNFDISGKALAQYRIDAGAWQNFTINYNVPITSDGNFLVDVNLVDNAGNQTLIENLEAFLMLPPNSTTFITPLEQIYYKGTIDNNIIFISWNEATHPAGRPITYDINYINSLGENTNLVSSSSDLNYSWDITLIDDGNYWLVGLVKDDRNLTANFSLDYNFTIQQYVEIPPSFETTAPTGSYDKRELIRVEFTILDANQSTFLVDINYSDTSNFGTGTILIQDENIATSSVVNCIQLGNNFSCYYDANLLSADDGDYYALVNVQGQGADASPQFNIYLGVDPEPTEKVYSQRYVNPNYEQRDENIYYNPATAYFLTDSEKQNIYLEQNTYLLIGVLIILGIGVFLLWKKRK